MRRHAHPQMAQWYQDHLQSERWITFRDYLLRKRGEKCEDCGWSRSAIVDHGPLNLHHITYARVGHERQGDLRLLCKHCHFHAHKTHDIPYLFLIYRDNYKEDVQPILKQARRDSDFEYPRYRWGKGK